MPAVLILLLASPLSAQDTTSFAVLKTGSVPAIARTHVSVEFSNTRLDAALLEITHKAGLGLTYRPNLPGLDKLITARLTDVEAASAMLRVLSGSRIEALMKPNGTTVLLRERNVSIDAAMPTGNTPLAENVIPLAEVVVTPGQFGIAHEAPSKPQTLTREQISTLPQLGEDIYRTVNRLPGMASNEMSAKLTVRGGNDESLLVLLDGIELFEPYHLKDFDGSLSIIDVAAIGGVDISTGGFTADFGNRLTGVFDMRTSTRITEKAHTSIGLSLSNARFMSEGSFGDGKGLWLLSARRGYLDILLHLIGETSHLEPRYYDALGKVIYQVNDKHRLSAHLLRAGDTGKFVDDDDVGEVDSNYGSTYGWVAWDASLLDGLKVSTRLFATHLDWHRFADEHDACCNDYSVRDDRAFSSRGIKQDWQFGTERVLFKFGGDVRSGDADYTYYKRQADYTVRNGVVVRPADSIGAVIAPSGTSTGAYIAQRVRPWQRLTLEAGLRWDRQSYTKETEWSPRVNAALNLPGATTLRAAWGRYAQPEQLFQIHVQDAETTIMPAERAEQLVFGLEKQLGGSITARVETYRRREWSLRPRYYNLGNSIEAVGEVGTDRVQVAPDSGSAQGVEFFVQHTGARTSWSASYAVARAYDVVNDVRINRPLEQRHTFYADYSYSAARNWRLSAAWAYHSGWPTTAADFRVNQLQNGGVFLQRVYLQPFDSRLDAYHRLDLRATRRFNIKHGSLTAFVDVFNVYNHDNPQRFEYSVNYNASTQKTLVSRGIETLLPRLPSVGFTWEF